MSGHDAPEYPAGNTGQTETRPAPTHALKDLTRAVRRHHQRRSHAVQPAAQQTWSPATSGDQRICRSRSADFRGRQRRRRGGLASLPQEASEARSAGTARSVKDEDFEGWYCCALAQMNLTNRLKKKGTIAGPLLCHALSGGIRTAVFTYAFQTTATTADVLAHVYCLRVCARFHALLQR